MYKELNIAESDGVWAAYFAICDMKDETERLLAACASKENELAELRGQTAELFAERLAAEGADEEAVCAAKAMWKSNPESAARAVLGCDIAEAANPYGCNQYGHGFREPHGAAGGRGQKTFDFFSKTQTKAKKKKNDDESVKSSQEDEEDLDKAILRAANPYGCNQYGEGWKKAHNGIETWRPGNKGKKKK